MRTLMDIAASNLYFRVNNNIFKSLQKEVLFLLGFLVPLFIPSFYITKKFCDKTLILLQG